MKKIMNAVQAWWKRLQSERRQRSVVKLEERLKREADELIQVREYDGLVFVSINELPILVEDELDKSLVDTIGLIRQRYVYYELRQILLS